MNGNMASYPRYEVTDFMVGTSRENQFVISKEQVKLFSNVSDDHHPLHTDVNFSQARGYSDIVVHGMLVGSLFGGLLGSKLPGCDTIHLGQTLNFKKPVFIDEEITAVIEVIKIRKDKPIITFQTICYKRNNEIAIEGEAVVKID